MEKFTKSTKKFEIVDKKSIEQIEKYNRSLKKSYSVFENKIIRIKEKVEKLKIQLVEEENKLWETEQEKLDVYGKKLPIQIKAQKSIEEDFFSNVTISYDPYEAERVYLKNGKWFTITVYYPTKNDGGIDDEHPYIKTKEIEVKK